MADFIWFLLVVLTLAVASYQRTSLVTAVAMGAGVMILGTLFGDIGLLGWVCSRPPRTRCGSCSMKR